MSAPVSPGGAPEGSRSWWRADLRTFVMNLWALILLVFYSLQGLIFQMLFTPPWEWGELIRTEVSDGRIETIFSNLFIFVVGILGLLFGSLNWWFTRYSLDDVAVCRRSGIFFKKSRTIRLESVQSVDISRPLVARLLGVSEVRFEVADGAGEALHIKYLSKRKANQLRTTAMESLALLRARAEATASTVSPVDSPAQAVSSAALPGTSPLKGTGDSAQRTDASQATSEGRVVFRISTARLLASILLENLLWFIPVAAIMGVSVILTAVFSGVDPFFLPTMLLPSLAAPLVGYLSALWARFDNAANFRVTWNDRGSLTLRYGFTGTHTQNVLVERVQAVQIEQSLLWMVFGWYRLKMTIAGIGVDAPKEGVMTRNIALPVGNEAETIAVLRLLIPELDESQAAVLMAAARGSRRNPLPAMSRKTAAPQMLGIAPSACWLDPLTAERRALTSIPFTERAPRASSRPDAGIEEHATGDIILLRDGFFVRTLSAIPMRRVLSVSWTQGPLERACGCATLHLNTVPGPVRTVARHLPPRTGLVLASAFTERLEGTQAYYRVPE